MLGVTHWGRQIRFLLGLPAGRRYTAEQVQQYLSGQGGPVENVDIEQAVARLPVTLSDPRVRRQYDGFQRYVEVLPRIIFRYHRGVAAEAISDDLSFVATGIGVETVIWITSRVVADLLNRAG